MQEYTEGALQNAFDLLTDAKILLENKRYSRAYFLACSSIEETGKAYLSFSAQGRNLNNQGIHTILRDAFEDHPQKTISAFICWINLSDNKRESIKGFLEIVPHLKRGRESSMYVDVNTDNSISLPKQIVRPIAAEDSIKLSENCYFTTKKYIAENQPESFNSFQDKLFCLKRNKLKTVFSNDDFGEYLLEQIKKEGANIDFAKCIVTYHDSFLNKGKSFKK